MDKHQSHCPQSESKEIPLLIKSEITRFQETRGVLDEVNPSGPFVAYNERGSEDYIFIQAGPNGRYYKINLCWNFDANIIKALKSTEISVKFTTLEPELTKVLIKMTDNGAPTKITWRDE